VQSGDHPALSRMNTKAQVYYKQGQYEEAELLSLKTLEIRQRVLGEEHPDAAKSINRLVELYEAWNKPEEAEKWRAKLPQTENTSK